MSPAKSLSRLRERVANSPLMNQGFVRNVLTIMTGTAISQAVTLAAMPILSRIYSPAAFGLLATFVVLCNVASQFSCLGYQGSIVLPIFASANRDDAQFPEAARFDITRNPQGHVAFGFGIHFCLGASLARLEARVAFEELLGRVTRLERTGAETEYIDSFLLRGPKALPLRYETA